MEKPSSFAIAFATRSKDESERFSRLVSEYLGREIVPIDDDLRQKEIVLRAETVDKLMLTDNPALQETILKNYLYQDAALSVKPRMEEVIKDINPFAQALIGSMNTVEASSRGIGEIISDTVFDSTGIQNSLRRELKILEGVKNLSKERHTEPERFFEDEQLYIELVRESFTAEETVDVYLHLINRVTFESMMEMCVKNFLELCNHNPLMRLFLMLQGIEDIEKRARDEFYGNHQIVESIEDIATKSKKGMSYVIIGEIERFWGPGSANNLPAHQRMQLIFPEDKV